MPLSDHIEIRSEEVQEIIGTPPAKIVRIGITILFILITVLLIGSFFFKYPDIITARISVKGDNPPAEIQARATGKIIKLNVKDKDKVSKNQVLAIIENTCNYSDLIKLKKELKTIEEHSLTLSSFVLSYHFSENYQVGELQKAYSGLIGQIKEYKDYTEFDYHDKKNIAYKKQIVALTKYLMNLKSQINLSKTDLNLSEKQLQRDSGLYKKEFLSLADFEKSKSNVISKKNTYESLKSSFSNVEIRITETEQNILETEIQKVTQKRDYESRITETIANLNAQIKLWEQTYLLTSPVKGIVN
ncbi:MAG: hypothetical protein DRI94_13370, partial [Bacteroidetes bacterium]